MRVVNENWAKTRVALKKKGAGAPGKSTEVAIPPALALELLLPFTTSALLLLRQWRGLIVYVHGEDTKEVWIEWDQARMVCYQ